MNTLAERLKYARESTGLSQQQVADIVGMKQPSYYKVESGKTLRTTFLNEIARALNVSADWLLTGKGSPDQNRLPPDIQAFVDGLPNGIPSSEIDDWSKSIFIPLYDVSFCCGDGAGHVEFEALKRKLPFDDHFFNKRGIRPQNFKLIYAKGDSMAPYINDKDAVGVDISEIEPKEGEVYALFLDGHQMIKRIFLEGGGVLRLESDNKIYKDKIISPENGDSLHIIGRVRYRSG